MKTLDLMRYDAMRQRRHVMKVRAQQAWHDKHCPNCAEERVRQDIIHMMRRATEEAEQQARARGDGPAITELQPSTKH